MAHELTDCIDRVANDYDGLSVEQQVAITVEFEAEGEKTDTSPKRFFLWLSDYLAS